MKRYAKQDRSNAEATSAMASRRASESGALDKRSTKLRNRLCIAGPWFRAKSQRPHSCLERKVFQLLQDAARRSRAALFRLFRVRFSSWAERGSRRAASPYQPAGHATSASFDSRTALRIPV